MSGTQLVDWPLAALKDNKDDEMTWTLWIACGGAQYEQG